MTHRSILTALLLAATSASADPGLPSGELLPPGTLSLSLGSSQTAPGASGGQTGRQVYTGALTYRGTGPWQWGASVEVFDDEPADLIAGRRDNISHLGLGLAASYRLSHGPRLSTVVQGAGQWVYTSRGASIVQQGDVPSGDKSTGVALSLSASATYRLTADTWLSGRLGYTHLPDTAAGSLGFGGCTSVRLGLAHRWSERLLTYGSITGLHRQQERAFDAGGDGLYTVGARFALTRQSDLTLYVTNAFGTTPIGSDLLFYGDTKAPTFGAVATYRPSGQGARAPRFGPRATRVVAAPAALTLSAARSLPPDRLSARLSYGDGAGGLSLHYAPDPLIQLDLSVERLALGAGSDFHNDTSARYTIGGTWQPLDRAQGGPLDLSLHVSAGRDVRAPTLGVLEAGISATAAFGPAQITLAPRAALYADRRLLGLGVGISYDLSPQITALAETHLLRDDSASWAVGARYRLSELPLSLELFATNAAGLSGVGPLLSTDSPHIGFALTWDTPLDWL